MVSYLVLTCFDSRLHGAPGAQKAQEPFTGQYAPTAGFYNNYNYGRATQFLSWMTEVVH